MAARLLFALLALALLASRVGLNWSLSPIFDVDTWKYFGGADSLWSGSGWAPIFLTRHEGGGALHAVPGYSWFMVAVWNLAGGRTLSGVALAQAAVSCLGLLAFADLARRSYGIGAGVVVLALFAASPSLAWLDHFLMPESLGAACFAIATWCVAVTVKDGAASRASFAGALAAGSLLSFAILLRTSSQAFVPFPFLLAAGSLRSWKPLALWSVAYAAALVVPLLPWVIHNQQVHGHAVVSASTGRALYFSGVWSDTIDRRAQLQKLGPGRPADVMSSFYLLDAQFQHFLDQGMGIVEADSAMRRLALAEYRAAGLGRYLSGRTLTLAGLFERESFGRRNNVLIDMLSWYLADGSSAANIRQNMEKRWAYTFTPEAVALIDDTHRAHPGTGAWFRSWVEKGSFDGWPLVLAFLASAGVLLAQPRRHAFALVCWVVPVLAYLAVYTVFGNPLYRYQVIVHGPMLAVVGVATWRMIRGFVGALARSTERPVS